MHRTNLMSANTSGTRPSLSARGAPGVLQPEARAQPSRPPAAASSPEAALRLDDATPRPCAAWRLGQGTAPRRRLPSAGATAVATGPGPRPLPPVPPRPPPSPPPPPPLPAASLLCVATLAPPPAPVAAIAAAAAAAAQFRALFFTGTEPNSIHTLGPVVLKHEASKAVSSFRTSEAAKMINIAGVVSIVLFYIMILGVGIWAARKKESGNDSEEEVMLAGRNIGLFVGIFTMTAATTGLPQHHLRQDTALDAVLHRLLCVLRLPSSACYRPTNSAPTRYRPMPQASSFSTAAPPGPCAPLHALAPPQLQRRATGPRPSLASCQPPASPHPHLTAGRLEPLHLGPVLLRFAPFLPNSAPTLPPCPQPSFTTPAPSPVPPPYQLQPTGRVTYPRPISATVYPSLSLRSFALPSSQPTSSSLSTTPCAPPGRKYSTLSRRLLLQACPDPAGARPAAARGFQSPYDDARCSFQRLLRERRHSFVTHIDRKPNGFTSAATSPPFNGRHAGSPRWRPASLTP
ncbi:High-affinity choline transporter 1-like protein [Gryllus bimaculatus]|nr:High-affinity choline transporter 1-like protein [Gryllus bimaculatus]